MMTLTKLDLVNALASEQTKTSLLQLGFEEQLLGALQRVGATLTDLSDDALSILFSGELELPALADALELLARDKRLSSQDQSLLLSLDPADLERLNQLQGRLLDLLPLLNALLLGGVKDGELTSLLPNRC